MTIFLFISFCIFLSLLSSASYFTFPSFVCSFFVFLSAVFSLYFSQLPSIHFPFSSFSIFFLYLSIFPLSSFPTCLFRCFLTSEAFLFLVFFFLLILNSYHFFPFLFIVFIISFPSFPFPKQLKWTAFAKYFIAASLEILARD